MSNRNQKFHKPIYLTDGTIIGTLADARKWLLGTGSNGNEFQIAAGLLLKATDGGSLEKAREAVANAAFLSAKLDQSKG